MPKTTAKPASKSKKPAAAPSQPSKTTVVQKGDKSIKPTAKVTAAAPAAPKKTIVTVPAKKPMDAKAGESAGASESKPVTGAMSLKSSKPVPRSAPPAPLRSSAKISASDDDDDDNRGSSAQDDDDNGSRVAKPSMSTNDLFTSADLESFRVQLNDEKRKLLHKARQTMDSGNIALDKDEMYDEVDLASATVEQNLTFRLLDRDRKLLAEIEHALYKLNNGEFGFCEGTGEPIPKRRLELRPWCRYSVKYKEQLERMKKSGRGVVDEDEAF